MTSIFKNIRRKATGRSEGKRESEPTFSIQPHPAKTNDPADLQPTQPGGGLRSDPVMGAHNARGPHIPAPEIMSKMPAAMNHDDLAKREAELNRR